uniref:Uncharacterized protein n=1 Tax=Arion vulgaris TaxID=1028688 RepID=A0A0B7A1E6_9EUPU
MSRPGDILDNVLFYLCSFVLQKQTRIDNEAWINVITTETLVEKAYIFQSVIKRLTAPPMSGKIIITQTDSLM